MVDENEELFPEDKPSIEADRPMKMLGNIVLPRPGTKWTPEHRAQLRNHLRERYIQNAKAANKKD